MTNVNSGCGSPGGHLHSAARQFPFLDPINIKAGEALQTDHNVPADLPQWPEQSIPVVGQSCVCGHARQGGAGNMTQRHAKRLFYNSPADECR